MLYVGIDTGTNTGMAIWDGRGKRFLSIECVMLHQALEVVGALVAANPGEVLVRFEDARLRTWYGSRGREALQGAGSIKRDCNIWEEYLTDKRIRFEAVPPKNNVTKLRADAFARITGWQGRTNEHERDAAMLVYGR